MKMRLLTVALAAILLPLALGCGRSESSYQDRQGDVDVENLSVDPPSDMEQAPGS